MRRLLVSIYRINAVISGRDRTRTCTPVARYQFSRLGRYHYALPFQIDCCIGFEPMETLLGLVGFHSQLPSTPQSTASARTVGFEPTLSIITYGFGDRCLKPFSHVRILHEWRDSNSRQQFWRLRFYH
jgi:hypothetical protein